MASSYTVTSLGVPNTAVVMRKASDAVGRAAERDQDRLGVRRGRGRRPRITAELVLQPDQGRVRGGFDVPVQPVEQVSPPLGQVHDARRHPSGMQAQPQDVDRRLQQRGRSPRSAARCVVGRDQLPPAVDDHGRVRLVGIQHALDRLVHGLHRRIGQPVGGIRGRVAARHSSTLRSRSGTSSCWARRRIISLVGRDRPVSTNDRCRADTSARRARSSWVSLRRSRQPRSSWPTGTAAPRCGWATVVGVTLAMLGNAGNPPDYPRGNAGLPGD